MKHVSFIKYSMAFALLLSLAACANTRKDLGISFVGVKDVKVEDPFWSPKFRLWTTITANDVFDKFEGKHDTRAPLSYSFCKDLLNGVNVIKGNGITAVPYYAVGNRKTNGYKVWIPVDQKTN